MGTTETTPRERLVAMVAALTETPLGDIGAAIDAKFKAGEAYVAAMEAEPEKPVQCPCCTKLVVLCREHYQLTEPGKPCVTCRRGE